MQKQIQDVIDYYKVLYNDNGGVTNTVSDIYEFLNSNSVTKAKSTESAKAKAAAVGSSSATKNKKKPVVKKTADIADTASKKRKSSSNSSNNNNDDDGDGDDDDDFSANLISTVNKRGNPARKKTKVTYIELTSDADD